MKKPFEIRTKQGLFRLVDDCELRFIPKGGKPFEFTVQETHKLLNLLYDYRREIIETNLEQIHQVERAHERNRAYGFGGAKTGISLTGVSLPGV